MVTRILQKQIAWVILMFVVIGSLNYQQISFLLQDNWAKVLALGKIIPGNQTKSDLADELLPFVIKTLNVKTPDKIQTQTRGVIIGSLYWSIDEQNLAMKSWIDAGIQPEFFINKIESIAQQSSLNHINRAILLSPDRSELLYYKGLHFELNEDGSTANQWYELAKKHNNWVNLSTSFDVLHQRGQYLYNTKQWGKAEKVLKTAVSFSKQMTVTDKRQVAITHRWLGIIAQNNGRLDEAKEHFIKATELYPEDFWNYLSLGLIAGTEKQPEKSDFKYFDYARTVAPYDLQAYIYPASHYFGLGQLDKWRYFCEKTPRPLQRQQQWLDVCRLE